MKLKSIVFSTLLATSVLLVGCTENEEDVTGIKNDTNLPKVEEVEDLTTEEEKQEEEEVQEDEQEVVESEDTTTEQEVTKNEVKPSKPVETGGTTEKVPVEYVRVVDGDTAKVIYEGEEMSVRYLLIDTPESKHPKVGWQPYGDEASKFNENLLNNANQVYLEFDVGQRLDHYGRLLAYVWADDVLINEKIVEEGLAVKAYVKAPNTRHLDRIEKAQEIAKSNGKNVWSLSGYVQGEDFKGGSKIDNNASYPQFTAPEKKSNSTSTPTTPKYDETGKRVFKNCTELREVYPDGVPNTHEAYQPKMDRNKDGWACE